MLRKIQIYVLSGVVAFGALTACGAEGDYPGLEYAPQMYHSVPYEPLTQITDESQGKWLSVRADERGEFYNTNPYNPTISNMRLPAENTVPRDANGYLPFRMPKDSVGSTFYLEEAGATLKNPFDENESVLEQGKVLYTSFCYPCHGEVGQGDGPVGMIYKGVANISTGQIAEKPPGYIFYVITHGKGRMWPHDKQIAVEDRWKIVKYVQALQKQGQ